MQKKEKSLMYKKYISHIRFDKQNNRMKELQCNRTISSQTTLLTHPNLHPLLLNEYAFLKFLVV